MGYACYTITRRGQQIEAGYAVSQLCDTAGCTELIDRGLDHLCGETPGDPEHGCGGYHCSKHMYFSFEEDLPQLCAACSGIAPKHPLPQAVVHEPFHQRDRPYLADSAAKGWTDFELALVALSERSFAGCTEDPRADEARRIGERFTADEARRIDAYLVAGRHDRSRLEQAKVLCAGIDEDGEDLRWLVVQLQLAWDRLDRLRDHIDQGGSELYGRSVAAAVGYVRWSRMPHSISPCNKG